MLFFTWALSSPIYERLHGIIENENYYSDGNKSEITDIDSVIDQAPENYQSTLYLHRARTMKGGTARLKYIRLAIQAQPADKTSYDTLYYFITHIPLDFGIAEYLNRLYATPNARQQMIAEITRHRFEMFDTPAQQKSFLANLSIDLKKAFLKLKTKSLKELNTQIRRNE